MPISFQGASFVSNLAVIQGGFWCRKLTSGLVILKICIVKHSLLQLQSNLDNYELSLFRVPKTQICWRNYSTVRVTERLSTGFSFICNDRLDSAKWLNAFNLSPGGFINYLRFSSTFCYADPFKWSKKKKKKSKLKHLIGFHNVMKPLGLCVLPLLRWTLDVLGHVEFASVSGDTLHV